MLCCDYPSFGLSRSREATADEKAGLGEPALGNKKKGKRQFMTICRLP